ncbi:MAG: cation:proton antiporter [Chitinispirillales bacterium]|jgi:Kef-type K+ transport system membrane component KefB/mannitol/fructose-specific phosphotransferase system IIA component (Ntr-type)|nr:cation:proton antiporter [Chitinispirillales bacterium]
MYDKLLVFSVLLFSVFAVPIIAGRTKIPAIVFYILFGVAFERFVFRLEATRESFYVFSEVGKLYLMFIAGVEIDTYLFRKNAAKSVVFGALSFAVPQVLGTVVIIGAFGYTASAALLTASLFASHTLLSLAIINKFGLGNSKPVSVAVGATIITDVAVLGLLAVVADIARGLDIPAAHWVMLFGGWVLFICAIIYFLPKIAKRVFKAFSEDGYAQFLFVFATACLLSWAAHFLRLESLIGAFFCGLALSRLIPNQSILMTKINFVGNTVFIPFFFISAGMLINPDFFVDSGEALILAVVLTALAMATKTAASFICGKMFKFSTDAILMTAGMTIQQAATTIVCAVIGYEVGVINETIFNAGMLHILLTCTIGEIISVHYAEKYARSLQTKAGGAGAVENSKTLVFIPNAASCSNLLDFACYFRHYAKRYTISPLAHAVDGRESGAEAEAVLGICMNHANELEEVYRPEMRIAGSVTDGLLRAAAETRAGMAVCPIDHLNQALVDDCPARLVFTRIVRGFPATKRVAAVFMPTSENRSDLAMLIAEIKHLSRQIGAQPVFHISENQRGKISEKIDKYLRSDAKYAMVVKSQWSAIKRDLPNLVGKDDAVIIAMGTRQKLFRLPSADRYPIQLAQRLKQNNVIAAYPPLSLVGASDGDESELFHDDSPVAAAETLALEAIDRGERDFRDIVISVAYKIGAHVSDLYDTLLPSLELYPVELIPEAVLVHAHTEAVDRPRAFVWHQREKIEIQPTNISPNVLIIVLNPLHGDPQTHLKTLSRIAGMFMTPRVEGVIAECKDSAELVERLEGVNGLQSNSKS